MERQDLEDSTSFELITRNSALAPPPTVLRTENILPVLLKGARWPLDTSLFVMHEASPVVGRSFRGEQEHLLGRDIEFQDMTERTLNNKDPAYMDDEPRDETIGGHVSGVDGAPDTGEDGQAPPVYRVYKRRWFGLMQLVLMNIIVSWDVSPECHIVVPVEYSWET